MPNCRACETDDIERCSNCQQPLHGERALRLFMGRTREDLAELARRSSATLEAITRLQDILLKQGQQRLKESERQPIPGLALESTQGEKMSADL